MTINFIPERDEKGRAVQMVDHVNDMIRHGDAVTGTIPSGQTVAVDLKLDDTDELGIQFFSIKGGVLFGTNIEYGCYGSFSVVDKDGVGVALGWYTQEQFDQMGNLYVVKKWVRKRYFKPDCVCEMESEAYSDPVPKGLYLRCNFHNAGSNTVTLFINYDIYYKQEWVVS